MKKLVFTALVLVLVSGCTIKLVDKRYDPEHMQQIVNALSADTGKVAQAVVTIGNRVDELQKRVPPAPTPKETPKK